MKPMLEGESIIDSFTGDYSFLSNFYPSKIIYKNMTYSSVEHAYQAAKAVKSSDRVKIRDCGKPSNAKKIGRVVKIREDWEAVKFDVMRECLVEKFKDDDLAVKLLKTNNSILIEGNTWGDKIWGKCKGQGQNWLGRLLMEIRQNIKEGLIDKTPLNNKQLERLHKLAIERGWNSL